MIVSNRAGDDSRIPSKGQPDLAVDYIVILNSIPTIQSSSTTAAAVESSTSITSVSNLENAPLRTIDSDEPPRPSATAPRISPTSSRPTEQEGTAVSTAESPIANSKNQSTLIAAVCSSLAAIVVLFGIMTAYSLYRRKQVLSNPGPRSFVSESYASTPIKEDLYPLSAVAASNQSRSVHPGTTIYDAQTSLARLNFQSFEPAQPFVSLPGRRISYGGTTGFTRDVGESSILEDEIDEKRYR